VRHNKNWGKNTKPNNISQKLGEKLNLNNIVELEDKNKNKGKNLQGINVY